MNMYENNKENTFDPINAPSPMPEQNDLGSVPQGAAVEAQPSEADQVLYQEPTAPAQPAQQAYEPYAYAYTPVENSYYGTPAANGVYPNILPDDPGEIGNAMPNGQPYTFQQSPEGPQDKKKRRKEKASAPLGRKTMAILMACTITASALLGIGGGLGAYYFASKNGSGNNPSVIQQAVERVNSTNSNGNTDGVLTVAEIAKLAGDSVVEITTSAQSNGMFQQNTVTGAGSGVILTSDGYIVTNNHVIEGASKISIRLKDGTTYDATLVGTDSKTDVAILKVDAKDLKAVVLGNSKDLNVGDMAVAIGNPLGQLGGTVTDGIISALDREITLSGETRNLLQTNAAINPGNSGGGLFNQYGELIGIVVAKSTGTDVEGLGFAIPIDDVKSVINDLMANGKVSGRITLGLSLVEITSPQAAIASGVNQTGVYVKEVTSGSSAEKAGFESGDRLVSVGDTAIESTSDLTSFLNEHKVGDTVTFTVSRNGKTVQLSVTLAEAGS